jgi:hypothetical protein
MIVVPLFDLKFLRRTRGTSCRNFKSAALEANPPRGKFRGNNRGPKKEQATARLGRNLPRRHALRDEAALGGSKGLLPCRQDPASAVGLVGCSQPGVWIGARRIITLERRNIRWNAWEDDMPRTRQTSKRATRKEVVPVVGAVGVSLSLASGASAAPAVAAADVPSWDTTPSQLALSEEEIADVSLGTFYVFDKENAEIPGQQYAQRGCGGCGGCRGCARGCRACRACGGCGGCSCGCCISWGACRFVC